jgi:hypothetical protein
MNLYGAKAMSQMSEYDPRQYHQIEDKEAFFNEIGEEAQRQVSSTYSSLSRPELGEKDLATTLMAEELVRELIFPTESGETEEPMDQGSAMALSLQVHQDFWAESDSDQADRTTSPRQEQ